MKLFYSLLLAASVGAMSNLDSLAGNPYDGQYDVNHYDPRHSSWNYKQGEIIVKLKAGNGATPVKLRASKGKVSSSSSALESLLRDNGIQEAEQLMTLTGSKVAKQKARSINGQPVSDADLSGLYALRFDATKTQNIYTLITDLQNLNEVEYAEPNYIVQTCSEPESYTADPLYTQQWGPAAIGLDKLWEVPTVSTKRPVIAILDTGVDITHPDLADNIWTNSHEANGADNRDDDGNGFIDDIHGWDFVNNSARMRDNNGHGTHCAGIAGAVGGNGIGITGANPDAYIMPIAVLQSNGTGDVATIIKGIDYATANGADLLSMSFGTYSNSIALHDALGKAYQKAVLVAAAGNDFQCINPHKCPLNNQYGAPMFPAAYSFVLGIEASGNGQGAMAGFSNFDCDGPITSMYPSDLFNYELRAPGTSIISTFPNGQYKSLNGTSMACPLAAGAISRLMDCRGITSKEELFGDLIATSNGNMDVFSAYSLMDADRKPTLSLVTYRLDDDKMGDGDGRPDAGETIRFYPTLRNNWSYAKNITYSLEVAENEDLDIIEFVDGSVKTLSNLSSYASVEGETPVLIKINPNCADGRIISLIFKANCDNISTPLEQKIKFSVENGIELGGIIKKDLTLSPDKNYIITTLLGIPENVTLTILPGTVLNFKQGSGIAVSGNLIANGLPGKMIEFKSSDLNAVDITAFQIGKNEISYCLLKNLNIINWPIDYVYNTAKHCIFKDINISYGMYCLDSRYTTYEACNFYNVVGRDGFNEKNGCRSKNTNIIKCKQSGITDYQVIMGDLLESSNSFNNVFKNEIYSLGFYSSIPQIYTPYAPNYLGTKSKDILEKRVLDINNPLCESFGEYDLSNSLTRPNTDAHAIVWKVVVNDYDAQDEYDILPPLGVGQHKFEVYFSKPMNHEKTPMIAMGVREPYTQTAIAEEGSWRSETMENGDVIDIYTAYLTIKGKDNFDGVNTIYVADAEDEEFFPIPIEDVRFHVNVQSAGAMSTGFIAEAGVGKVKLTWENPDENFDDMLGYNMYRYTLDENEVASEPVKINENLLTDEELIDYDIVPGTTYCYYYKVLRTSLDENAPSKIVAATPRAAGKGDADASGDVDVADVVTEVNYMVGREPKPFIFDAADVNEDSEIDILDVVGTVNIIMKPQSVASMTFEEQPAVYSVDKGILYVNSPVELAGVQLDLVGNRGFTEFKTLEALKGMETTADWVNDETYRFVAFSLSGKTLGTGKQAILEIGDAMIENLILVDTKGNRVAALLDNSTSGISTIVGQQIKNCYPNPFDSELNVVATITSEQAQNVEISLTNLAGATVMRKSATIGYGEHTISFNTTSLPSGFYIVTLKVDGKSVQSVKAIKK